MASVWMFFVVVLLCYSSQLQIVSAGKRELGPKSFDNWFEASSSHGNVDSWVDSRKKLSTEFRAGGGASWFITPFLNTPNTSYLDIEALCSNNTCQLEIYGQSDSSASSKYFESIQNVTFETRSHNYTTTIKKSYRYLRILARSTSKTKFYIYSMKMYHYFCEKSTIHNTDLSQVDSSTTNISRLFQCRDNAVASDGKSMNITVKCTPKGYWTFGGLKCECDKGFHYNNPECSRCSIDHYKIVVGNTKCQKCPDGKTNNIMNTKCECKEDHYIGNNEDGPCYTVPSKVEGLKIRQLSKTSANITWEKPRDNDGFNGLLTYSVKCYHCINESKCDTIVKNATFFPAETNFNTTYVIVSNLIFNKTYKFRVLSGRSMLKYVPGDKWRFTEQNFKLTGSRVTPLEPTVWMETSVTQKNVPAPSQSSFKPENILFIIGISTAGVAILFFILIVVHVRRKKRLLGKNDRENEIGLENVPQGDGNHNLFTNTNAIYEDIDDDILPETRFPTATLFEGVSRSDDMFWEFPRGWLRIERQLGEGNFGSVSKATVTPIHAMNTLKGGFVAVKTLKENASLKDREDFLNELNLMKKLEPHAHIVQLLGCCTQSEPHFLILEYLSGGDLLGFLRKSRGREDLYYSGECYPTSSLTEKNLLSFAWMTANGMAYLVEKEIVHRDLAARNVLVGEGNVCKISDFGLAREGTYERKSKARLPVKWMAPEDLFEGQCTSMSDVWSYGILLWEVFTIGDSPYPRVKGRDVPALIQSGYRMPKPKHLSDDMYSIMMECWKDEPHQRPLFKYIASYFHDKLTKFSKIYIDLTLYEEKEYVNFDALE